MFNVRAACYPAHVKSVVQLLSSTMQLVLGNCLPCDSDFLFELVYICRKRGDINQALYIFPEKKIAGVRSGKRGGHFNITLSSPPSARSISLADCN